MNKQYQRVLTGTRPSGKPHLGNYLGAFQPAIKFQENYELFLFLADYHSLNTIENPDEMRAYSIEIAATLIACGLDPNKSKLYCQSAIPEICELTWILGCLTPYGLMQRAHTLKDAQAKNIEVNMGVVNYPILMAADILVCDANKVPVGKDQKQHLEIARDLAQKFNNRYKETFVIPEALISESVGLVPGLDGQKMSKSKNNYIPIFGSDKEWKKYIMSIPTDSKGLDDPKDPDTCNIFALYKLLSTKEEQEELAEKYRKGGFGYGHAKLELLEKMKQTFSPMREEYFSLISRPKDLLDILHDGANKVRKIAVEKLECVKNTVGVLGTAR